MTALNHDSIWINTGRHFDFGTLKIPQEYSFWFYKGLGTYSREQADCAPKRDYSPPPNIPANFLDFFYYGYFQSQNCSEKSLASEIRPEEARAPIVKSEIWLHFFLGRNSFSWEPDTALPHKDFSFKHEQIGSDLRQKWFYRGAGTGFLRDLPNLGKLIDSEEKLLKNIPFGNRADFFFGIGWDIGERQQRFNPKLFSIYLKGLSRTQSTALEAGYAAFRNFSTKGLLPEDGLVE